MKSTFIVKATLLATLITAGQAFAQTLPNEIDHPQYLKIYQGLESVANTMTAEFNKLSAEKVKLEKIIAQMEQDQVAIPARNEELRQLINGKRQLLAQVESDMRGLEGVLNKIMEDLNKIDSMIARLQKDLSEEGGRSQSIQGQRQAISQDLGRLNARLQKEIQDENQSVQILNRHQTEIQGMTQNINDKDQERRELIRDLEINKRNVVSQRAALGQHNQALAPKRNQATQAQAKLPSIKADISANQNKIPALDAGLTPKLAKLSELKNELASRQPEVVKLEKENTELSAKIQANKTKINATGYTALVAKKANLEKAIADINAQIQTLSDSIVALKEAIKPELGRDIEIRNELRAAQQANNQDLVRRLKAEQDLLTKRIAPKRQEILRLEKQHENAALSVLPKTNELKTVTDGLPGLESQVTALQQEIDGAQAKIQANNVVIAANAAANAGLVKEIADLDGVIRGLTNEKTQLQNTIAALKQQETTITNQINTLNAEINQIEKEIVTISANISSMDKAIAEFPQSNRRLELNIQKLSEILNQKKMDALREDKLLQRIRQDRVVAERDVLGAQDALAQVEQALGQSQRLIRTLQTSLQEEQQNRDTLTRYNQDSIKKYDALKIQKTGADEDIAGASNEIGVNNQDIATIASDLPKVRSELSTLNPKVVTAENNMNGALNRTQEASNQYQNRLSLYQQHLATAQSLGTERAAIASVDGDKAGKVDAKTQAVKMATENAASHGKWEALLRGYTRGEIAGYEQGFDVGLSSESDASRGDTEGKNAGARRAKDHANLVLKPDFYIEELTRRIQEIEVAKRARLTVSSEKMMTLSAQSSKSLLKQDVPELSNEEVIQSRNIISSLDSMIDQSSQEIGSILNRRSSLSQARNAYAVLTAGANAANPNCSGVYKNVKDFVEACKSIYNSRYQLLFGTSHNNSFQSEYAVTFKSQIDSTFVAELNRLYPTYLKEATSVGKQVGVSNGQKEIFRQNFDRAEKTTYATNLPGEEERVENESINLVSELLATNAVLSLKGNARLATVSTYGISPGTQVDLSMIMKNVGQVASLGDSIVKITEVTSNLSPERREAPVASIAAKTASEVNIMKLSVNENAIPGSRVVVAGEIIHPGNHYRANRVETFRIETVLNVNPSVTATFEYDESPKVAGIFGGIKEHEVEVTVRPKFSGVNNYEVSIAEVGSNHVTVITQPIQTGALNKGQAKKLSLEYKMNKAAKGKTVSLKVTVKHDSKLVESFDLKVQAH